MYLLFFNNNLDKFYSFLLHIILYNEKRYYLLIDVLVIFIDLIIRVYIPNDVRCITVKTVAENELCTFWYFILKRICVGISVHYWFGYYIDILIH